ncbi:MAG TPA: hypothetical protein VGO97_01595 [Solirubrobacterales bacterium]|jgi:hypothetical protein|nr:hypothetical protein [Solirubrobacterales bacterium]
MNVPIAHAGHWLANMLYLVPVLVLVIGILFQKWADRNRDDDSEDVERGDGPGKTD